LTRKGGNDVKSSPTVHDRTIVILTILIVLTFTFAVVSGQPGAKNEEPLISTSQSPASLAASFDNDLNNHNSSGALTLFADGATLYDINDIAGCPSGPHCGTEFDYVGTAQIGPWLDYLVSVNVQLNETHVSHVSGNNVSWTVGFSDDPYRKLGVAPLETNMNATVDNGKFSSLSVGLTLESIRKLSLAIAASRASPYSAMAGGAAFGFLFLGLVFPTVGVYYVSKVKRLFATVPHLDKPWMLLGAGLGVLFVSVLILSLRDLGGISVELFDPLFSATLTICAFLVMASMILMKRVMLGESDE
jgi:hypothetical protein